MKSKKSTILKAKIEDIISETQLAEDYIEKFKSLESIADKYGFSATDIEKYILKLDLTRPDKKPILNQEQKEIVNGLLIGSSCISNNEYLHICYPVDKENNKNQNYYLSWLHFKLKTIAKKRADKVGFNARLPKNYLKTLNQIEHTSDYKFLDSLTPLSLAVWFADMAEKFDYGYRFYPPFQGWGRLPEYLESLGIKSNFDEYGVFLFLNTENSIKFTKIIKYHLHPSKLHKLYPFDRKHIIYLAGGMQNSPDFGVTWRRRCKHILNKKGYYCIDPSYEETCIDFDDNWNNFKDFNLFQTNMRKIIDSDLYFVDMSNHVVCLYDDFLGGGSYHEIGECYIKNKNLYLLNINKLPLNKMSWWALGCCKKVVNSFEELMELFEDINHA